MLNKLTELSYFKQLFFDFLRKLHLIIPELKKIIQDLSKML